MSPFVNYILDVNVCVCMFVRFLFVCVHDLCLYACDIGGGMEGKSSNSASSYNGSSFYKE